MRKEDFGKTDRTFIVNSHLGEILNFNDTVLAYDLLQCNVSDLEEYEKVDTYMPEMIIVKKTFPKYRNRQKNRIWKLKHFEDQNMPEEAPEDNFEHEEGEQDKQPEKIKKKSKKALKKEARQDRDIKKDKDYEYFLRDLEDDPEMRATVNLYKDDDVIGALEAQIGSLSLNDKTQTMKDFEKGKITVGG